MHPFCAQPIVASGQEGPCVLILEPSWHDDVMTIASPPLGAVAALNEGLARPIAVEGDLNATWFGPLDVAHSAFREPVSSDARTSKRWLAVH